MITIRASESDDQPTLIGLEAELRIATGVYALSSAGPLAAGAVDGLFGAVAWPQCRFRIAPEVVLDQQAFLPSDQSTAAFSWALSGDIFFQASLTIRPFFNNCELVSYRDTGFHAEPEDNGGLLTWLPRVLGPRFIADTNGTCREEFRELQTPGGKRLLSPAAFQFELTHRPSVLIIGQEGPARADASGSMGTFLAGLLQKEARAGHGNRADLPTDLQPLKAA